MRTTADAMPQPLPARRNGSTVSTAAALVLMAAPGPAVAFWGNTLAMEPQPFRQERVLEGRTFHYNDESFLQRNSFTTTRPGFHSAPLPRDHIEGTGGSTRTRELFVSHVEGKSVEGINRRHTNHDGTYAKVSLPFTWSPGNGAQLTLNPTVELHSAAFGGGNLRVRIPL